MVRKTFTAIVSCQSLQLHPLTRKGNILNQFDCLIDWTPIEKAIAEHYAPRSDAAGRPAYPGLLLFKITKKYLVNYIKIRSCN